MVGLVTSRVRDEGSPQKPALFSGPCAAANRVWERTRETGASPPSSRRARPGPGAARKPRSVVEAGRLGAEPGPGPGPAPDHSSTIQPLTLRKYGA